MTISTPRRYDHSEYEKLPQEIKDCVERIKETRKGLYIWGPVGTGKTYAIYAIKNRLEEMNIRVRIHSAPEMFDLIRDDHDHKDSYNLERILANRGVFIIDDLGTEKTTEWVSETLYKIINKRYQEVLPTIVTSNYSLGELSEKIGDRIPSRLAEMCDIIKLEGEDRRLQ